ncbi:hypothetical protein AWZ03_003712 [Drosophila navojoa]|uniref:Uncharacterized protein n=1 Tax=Drosophila navojoa TaxID=7232 RepID=A0A484BM48_DRONA|nr:uncharacterized protein LOC115562019 [Drosophila navojoa]TDG49936.1 hypothetical protein AWZ03_003712 [Drosophila navojoa]
MATNAPAHKASNMLSSRLGYKPVKLEMPQLARAYQPPTIVSVNAKDANKDKDKNKDKDRKQKMAVTKQSSNPKSYCKRTEAPAAAASASVQLAGHAKVTKVTKATSNEHTVVLARHVDQAQYGKQARKPKLDGPASRTKNLRPTPAETALPTNKHAKESKSPDRADAQRQIRTKNQSHNTKIFFDKYLKFAYDLSTPDGVRQLEAHFFPTDNPANRQTRKKSESGDTSERALHGGEERLSSVSMHTNSTHQVLQQSKCCDVKDK